MSFSEFKDFLSSKPELERLGVDVSNHLSKQRLGARLRVRDVAHFMRQNDRAVAEMFRALARHGVTSPVSMGTCPNLECEEALLEKSDEGEFSCDICEQRFPEEEVIMKEFHVLNEVPAPAEVAAAQLMQATPAAPFLHAKMQPWDGSFAQQDAMIESLHLRAHQAAEICKNLERYGMAILRLTGQPPGLDLLEAAIKYVGPPIEDQNGHIGWYKKLTPNPDGPAGTGEVINDLDFHVDGTQDAEQPALLAFQYVNEPDFGADSRFVDLSKVLADMDPELRARALVDLARPDAASCQKKGKAWTGPIVQVKPKHGDNAFGIRIRFDNVMTVNPACQWAYDLLKKRANDPKYCLEFQPQKGDIIIFDNLRLLHARTRVLGHAIRQHHRVWIKELTDKARREVSVGIRTPNVQLLSMIEARNNSLGVPRP